MGVCSSERRLRGPRPARPAPHFPPRGTGRLTSRSRFRSAAAEALCIRFPSSPTKRPRGRALNLLAQGPRQLAWLGSRDTPLSEMESVFYQKGVFCAVVFFVCQGWSGPRAKTWQAKPRRSRSDVGIPANVSPASCRVLAANLRGFQPDEWGRRRRMGEKIGRWGVGRGAGHPT